MRGVRAAATAALFVAALGPAGRRADRRKRPARGVRAAAAATLFAAALGTPAPPLPAAGRQVIPRLSDIAAVRRHGVRAVRAALVASLWAEETAGQCLIGPDYGPAADFGRVAKLVVRQTDQSSGREAGARALWAQMQAAGFSFAEAPASSAGSPPAVRVLRTLEPARRRAEGRRAA